MNEPTPARPAPPEIVTNRLFGAVPDELAMPFCALSPTISCSTALVALVLRHAREKDPRTRTTDVARELARTWALFVAGKSGNRVSVCGVPLRMLPLKEKGSIWSHAPVHATTSGGAKSSERAREARVTTKAAARALGRAGRTRERKADMEKDEQSTTQQAQAPGGEEKQARWPRVKFPNTFVHPYEMTDKSGKAWQKAICTIPDGVKVNGVDVGGFSLDYFLRDFHMEQKTLGKPIILALDPKEPVTLFKGRDDERVERKVMAWDLTKAMAKHAREFKERKQAEREKRNPSLEEDASRGPSNGRQGQEREHMRSDPVR